MTKPLASAHSHLRITYYARNKLQPHRSDVCLRLDELTQQSRCYFYTRRILSGERALWRNIWAIRFVSFPHFWTIHFAISFPNRIHFLRFALHFIWLWKNHKVYNAAVTIPNIEILNFLFGELRISTQCAQHVESPRPLDATAKINRIWNQKKAKPQHRFGFSFSFWFLLVFCVLINETNLLKLMYCSNRNAHGNIGCCCECCIFLVCFHRTLSFRVLVNVFVLCGAFMDCWRSLFANKVHNCVNRINNMNVLDWNDERLQSWAPQLHFDFSSFQL